MIRTLSHLIPWLFAAVLLTLPAASQTASPSPYPAYQYDSTFIVGGYDINRTWLIDEARDSLGFGFVAFYGAPTILDSSAVARSVATNGDSGAFRLRHLVDYNASSSSPLRFLFTPGTVGAIGKNATVLESYPGNDAGSVQASTFATVQNGTLANAMMSRHFVHNYLTPRDTHDTFRVVLDRPQYTWRAFMPGTNSIYQQLQATGRALPPAHNIPALTSIYSALAELNPTILDSSEFYRFAVTCKLSNPEDVNDLAPTDILLRVTLFRRDKFLQTGIGRNLCNIFVPIDTLLITVEMMTDEGYAAGDGYITFESFFPLVWKTVGSTKYRVSNYFAEGPTALGCGTTPCLAYCDSLLFARQALPDTSLHYLPATAFSSATGVTSSDVYYRIESSGKAAIDILRGDVGTHLFHALQRTSTFDTLINREVRAVYLDSNLNSYYHAFGLIDEPSMEQQRAFGIVSRKVQAAKQQTDNRSVYSEYYGGYDGIRVFSGDFDSTSVKTVQTVISDRYLAFGGFMPLFYANPQIISRQAADTLLLLSVRDTAGVITRQIAGNSPFDYAEYTKATQERFGYFRQRDADFNASFDGPWLSNLARCVQVSKFKYLERGPANPVFTLVDVHGYVKLDSGRYQRAFWKHIPTPEEIRAQVWLSMNCGVNGILFSEMIFGGELIGPLRLDETHRYNSHGEEYDKLRNYKDTAIYLDTMWVGFRSRFRMIKQVVSQLRHIDTVVGWKNLIFDEHQVSVHDTAQSFDDFPIVRTLRAERPVDTLVAFSPYSIPSIDSAHQTYLEVSHFTPTQDDSPAFDHGGSYLLITNRRLYPIDHAAYDSATIARLDWAANDTAAYKRNRSRGLGKYPPGQPRLSEVLTAL